MFLLVLSPGFSWALHDMILAFEPSKAQSPFGHLLGPFPRGLGDQPISQAHGGTLVYTVVPISCQTLGPARSEPAILGRRGMSAGCDSSHVPDLANRTLS